MQCRCKYTLSLCGPPSKLTSSLCRRAGDLWVDSEINSWRDAKSSFLKKEMLHGEILGLCTCSILYGFILSAMNIDCCMDNWKPVNLILKKKNIFHLLDGMLLNLRRSPIWWKPIAVITALMRWSRHSGLTDMSDTFSWISGECLVMQNYKN